MWRSWIPNSISLGNLLFGFIAMLLSSSVAAEENIESVSTICGLLILIAALLDGFDGFTARLLKVESPLGEYLDSLADLTTFWFGSRLYRISDIFQRPNIRTFLVNTYWHVDRLRLPSMCCLPAGSFQCPSR